jgi:hypothetical protein
MDKEFGKPFDRNKSRGLFVRQVQLRLDLNSLAVDVLHRMLAEFSDILDLEVYAPSLKLSDSYTTLHDHVLGAEILKQTDIEKRFLAFSGKGRAKEFFGGEDAELSGIAMTHIADHFANTLESAFRNGDIWRQILIRTVAQKFKNSNWWKDNGERVSKILQKNRDRLNKIKSVQNS